MTVRRLDNLLNICHFFCRGCCTLRLEHELILLGGALQLGRILIVIVAHSGLGLVPPDAVRRPLPAPDRIIRQVRPTVVRRQVLVLLILVLLVVIVVVQRLPVPLSPLSAKPLPVEISSQVNVPPRVVALPAATGLRSDIILDESEIFLSDKFVVVIVVVMIVLGGVVVVSSLPSLPSLWSLPLLLSWSGSSFLLSLPLSW